MHPPGIVHFFFSPGPSQGISICTPHQHASTWYCTLLFLTRTITGHLDLHSTSACIHLVLYTSFSHPDHHRASRFALHISMHPPGIVHFFFSPGPSQGISIC